MIQSLGQLLKALLFDKIQMISYLLVSYLFNDRDVGYDQKQCWDQKSNKEIHPCSVNLVVHLRGGMIFFSEFSPQNLDSIIDCTPFKFKEDWRSIGQRK